MGLGLFKVLSGKNGKELWQIYIDFGLGNLKELYYLVIPKVAESIG